MSSRFRLLHLLLVAAVLAGGTLGCDTLTFPWQLELDVPDRSLYLGGEDHLYRMKL